MQKMDNSNENNMESAPEIVQAELVEMSPATPWEWQPVRVSRPRRRWRLPLLLFVATCLTTFLVGGLEYAVPVMVILICHEMGHFIQAQRYGVYASFPYFIPMPIPPMGTLGAVIAMEPRVGHRRALFDIGITGPLAGLIPTIIFLVIGLQHSYPAVPDRTQMLFGDPLLLRLLADWIVGPIPKGYELMVDPMAFAGWVGLLVTSLNLMPIGQLDGGHILYALLRRKAHKVATLLLWSALVLVIWQWDSLKSWTLMLVLLMIMGPIHPPTANDDEPLGIGRYILGWLTLGFIVFGFTPVPLRFLP
jgi:membrane-associated protease RseP (regulator of RpoE activity)